MSVFLPILNGTLFGFSLIVAVGPQNTFVLRQGLAKSHIGAVVIVCVASDIALIAAGAAGIGAAVDTRPALVELVRIVGAVFLVTYAGLALRRAVRSESALILSVADGSVAGTISTCLAFTWLNPHVYLDTVLLLGAVAGSQGSNAVWFAAGAMLASGVWFTALGFGARLLRPLFSRPNASRMLDVAIAVMMFSIGVSLLHQGLNA